MRLLLPLFLGLGFGLNLFAEPISPEFLKEDFAAFPLKKFTDERTDSAALVNLPDRSKTFAYLLLWNRWRPVIYRRTGEARFPTPDKLSETYAALNVRDREKFGARLNGPLSVRDSQRISSWLRLPQRTIDSLEAYHSLRAIGLHFTSLFADPAEAAEKGTRWYKTDHQKLTEDQWSEVFGDVYDALDEWAHQRGEEGRLALMQRAFLKFPDPYSAKSVFGESLRRWRNLEGQGQNELHALLQGATFDGAPAWDWGTWQEAQGLLSLEPDSAECDIIRIELLGAMHYQADWPREIWERVTQVFSGKKDDLVMMSAIYGAVRSQPAPPVEFWREVASIFRTAHQKKIELTIAFVDRYTDWPSEIWNAVFELIGRVADPRTIAARAIVTGQPFTDWILKPAWSDSTWEHMLAFVEGPTNPFHGDDFFKKFLAKYARSERPLPPALLGRIGRALETTPDSRPDDFAVLTEPNWNPRRFELARELLDRDTDIVAFLLGQLRYSEMWPSFIGERIEGLLRSPRPGLRAKAIDALTERRQLPRSTWLILLSKIQANHDRLGILRMLALYSGEWPDEGNRCLEAALTAAPLDLPESEETMRALTKRRAWSEKTWSRFPELLRRAENYFTYFEFIEEIRRKPDWPEGFRSQLPALISDSDRLLWKKSFILLFDRPLSESESRALARKLESCDHEEWDDWNRILAAPAPWNDIIWGSYATLYRASSSKRKASMLYTIEQAKVPWHREFWEAILDDLETQREDPPEGSRAIPAFSTQKEWPPRAERWILARLRDPDPGLRLNAISGLVGRNEVSAELWDAWVSLLGESDREVFFPALFALPQRPWPARVHQALLRRIKRPDSDRDLAILVEATMSRSPVWTDGEWKAAAAIWRDGSLSLGVWLEYLPKKRAWPAWLWQELLDYEKSDRISAENRYDFIDRASAQEVWPEDFWNCLARHFSEMEFSPSDTLFAEMAKQKQWPAGVLERVEAGLARGQVSLARLSAIDSREVWTLSMVDSLGQTLTYVGREGELVDRIKRMLARVRP